MRRLPTSRLAVVRLAVALACSVALALVPMAEAQDIEKSPPPKLEDERSGAALGPAATRLGRFLLGDPAPDINLVDEDGRRFQLSVERRARPYLLAFARRPEDALEIENARATLDSLGIGSVVIAPFHRDRLRDFVSRPGIRFLYDRASHVARTFGLYDAVTSNTQPGAMLVDERQRIRLIVSGIMPGSRELVRSANEALIAARAKR